MRKRLLTIMAILGFSFLIGCSTSETVNEVLPEPTKTTENQDNPNKNNSNKNNEISGKNEESKDKVEVTKAPTATPEPTATPTPEPTATPTPEPTPTPIEIPLTDESFFDFWIKDDGTLKICGMLDNTLETIGIPEKIWGMQVTEIYFPAFRDCEALWGITIPESVTIIDDYAFERCSKLSYIELPDSLYQVNEAAFFGTAWLKEQQEKNSMLIIGSVLVSTREDISGDVVIPDGVVVIGEGAFHNRNEITSITIPASVQTIRSGAFMDCKALKKVNIEDGLLDIGDAAFLRCESLTSISIPASVTQIGSYAFGDCSVLSDISFPEKCEIRGDSLNGTAWMNEKKEKSDMVIGGNVLFYVNPNLETVTIPNNVTMISDEAFQNCDKLTEIIIPDGVTTIGNSAFDRCENLKSITLPNSVTYLGTGAFGDCTNLSYVYIPESVTTIGDNIFGGCENLEEVTLLSNIGHLNREYFSGRKKLKRVTLPEGLKSIGESAFESCYELTDVVIPSSVTRIDKSAFSSCKNLKEVVIPEGVTEICKWCFYGCESLTSFVIPDSVTTIASDTFFGNFAYAEVTSFPANMTVYCNSGSYANIWAEKRDIVYELTGVASITPMPTKVPMPTTIPASVQKFATEEFECALVNDSVKILKVLNSDSIEVIIPEVIDGYTVTGIDENAFYDCVALTSVVLPKTLTELPGSVFRKCMDLKLVHVTSGSYAEYICMANGYNIANESGTYVTEETPDEEYIIDGGLEGGYQLHPVNKMMTEFHPSQQRVKPFSSYVDADSPNHELSSFSSCKNLKKVVLPYGISDVSWSFIDCCNLESINIPCSVERIEGTFINCYKLREVLLSEGVKCLMSRAFVSCTTLESIYLPMSLELIDEEAFVDCTNLTTIYTPAGSYAEYWAKEHGYTVIYKFDMLPN